MSECPTCNIVIDKQRKLEATLREIANIAHHGGLTGLGDSDIRKLTLPYWDKAECDRLQQEKGE